MIQRTCIGCRGVFEQGALVRLYKAAAGEIYFDPAQRGEGRGAYLCMRVDCVAQALKKGGFARAFRSAAPYKDPRDVGRGLIESLRESAERARQGSQRARSNEEREAGSESTLPEKLTNWIRFADELETSLHTLSGKKPGKAPKETDGKTAP